MKKLVVVLVIAVLALGGGTIYLWKELDTARSQNAALQARLTEMEKTRQAFASAFSRRPQTAANDANDTAPAPAPAPGTARQPDRARSAALIAGVRQMLASPEGREMARSQVRMFLPQMYPDIGKSLNLTPDQVNKLFDLLAKQQSDQVGAAGLLTGDPGDPAAMQEMRLKQQQQQKQTNDADVAALLGSKYSQYQEYQQTLPVHRQVSQLQTMLGSGDNSLSDSQATSLTTALAAEQQRINQDTANAPQGRTAQDYLQRTTDNNQRLVDVASTHLNPQQLDSYKKMLDQQQSMAGVLLRAIGGQGAAQGQAGAAAPAGQ